MNDFELSKRIVDATSDAVIFADREGRVRLWNRGAELLFGHTAEAMIGQSLDAIIPERLRKAHWDGFERSLATGRTKYADRVLTTRSVHRNGNKLYVDLSFGLVKDANGAVVGAFAIGRDCTERYVADAALKARVRELEAQQADRSPGG
ncbi:MAG: PAS domain-containing protein [Rudaea sp.]